MANLGDFFIGGAIGATKARAKQLQDQEDMDRQLTLEEYRLQMKMRYDGLTADASLQREYALYGVSTPQALAEAKAVSEARAKAAAELAALGDLNTPEAAALREKVARLEGRLAAIKQHGQVAESNELGTPALLGEAAADQEYATEETRAAKGTSTIKGQNTAREQAGLLSTRSELGVPEAEGEEASKKAMAELRAKQRDGFSELSGKLKAAESYTQQTELVDMFIKENPGLFSEAEWAAIRKDGISRLLSGTSAGYTSALATSKGGATASGWNNTQLQTALENVSKARDIAIVTNMTDQSNWGGGNQPLTEDQLDAISDYQFAAANYQAAIAGITNKTTGKPYDIQYNTMELKKEIENLRAKGYKNYANIMPLIEGFQNEVNQLGNSMMSAKTVPDYKFPSDNTVKDQVRDFLNQDKKANSGILDRSLIPGISANAVYPGVGVAFPTNATPTQTTTTTQEQTATRPPVQVTEAHRGRAREQLKQLRAAGMLNDAMKEAGVTNPGEFVETLAQSIANKEGK